MTQMIHDSASDAELIELANTALRANRPAETRKLLVDFPKSSPHYCKALELVGFAANLERDWAASAGVWSKLSDLQPGRLGPMRQTVSAYMMSNDNEQGLAFADEALLTHSDKNGVQVERLRLLIALGRLEDVASIEQQVRDYALSSKDFSTTIQLARLAADTGNIDEALQLFDKASLFDPSRIDPDLYKGRTLYAAGRYNEAFDTWSNVAIDSRTSPSNLFEPNIFLGRISLLRKDLDAATAYFEAAITADGSRVEPYRNLVSIAMQQRDFVTARKVGELFADTFPNEGDSLLLLAEVAELQNEIDLADEHWQALFDRFGHTQAWNVRYASFLIRQDRLDKALAFWETRESEGQISDVSRYERANILYLLRRPQPALQVLQNELRPAEIRHEDGLLLQGNILRDVNRRSEAGIIYETGTRFFPENSTFWEGAIAYYSDIDSGDHVETLLATARSAFGVTTAKAHYALGRIHRAASKMLDAETHFERMLEIDPHHDKGRIIFMRMLSQTGRVQDAEVHAKIIRQSNWRNEEATSILARMSLIRNRGILIEPGTQISSAIFEHIVKNAPETSRVEGSKRVAIVTSSLGAGGAERQVAYTSQSLTADEKLTSLAIVVEDLNPVLGRDFFASEVEKSGHELLSIADHGRSKMVREAVSRFPECRDDIALLQSFPPEVSSLATPFYAWLKLNPTDVVHTWQDTVNVSAGIASVLAGVPKIILATRSTRPDSRRRLRPYLLPGYHALLSRPEVSVVNNSINGARDYEGWLGLESGEITTIHNGLDVVSMRHRASRRSVGKIRETLELTDDHLVLGGVMRFTEEKRPELFVDVAINAAKRDPNLRFVLVGDGPMRAGEIQKISAEGLSDRIILPGAQRPVEPWMAAFDMLFLSSRMEGLPNVLIEAQALGTPVATMQVGGAPETLENDVTGILINETNIDVIASMILEKLYDLDWRHMASKAGAARIRRHFSIEVMGAHTKSIYLNG